MNVERYSTRSILHVCVVVYMRTAFQCLITMWNMHIYL